MHILQGGHMLDDGARSRARPPELCPIAAYHNKTDGRKQHHKAEKPPLRSRVPR